MYFLYAILTVRPVIRCHSRLWRVQSRVRSIVPCAIHWPCSGGDAVMRFIFVECDSDTPRLSVTPRPMCVMRETSGSLIRADGGGRVIEPTSRDMCDNESERPRSARQGEFAFGGVVAAILVCTLNARDIVSVCVNISSRCAVLCEPHHATPYHQMALHPGTSVIRGSA